MSVSYSLALVRFGQLLCYADKCIVNIMKAYIEKNNLQVELKLKVLFPLQSSGPRTVVEGNESDLWIHHGGYKGR